MRGAATPTDCRSSPSSSATAKHSISVAATLDAGTDKLSAAVAFMVFKLVILILANALSCTRRHDGEDRSGFWRQPIFSRRGRIPRSRADRTVAVHAGSRRVRADASGPLAG